MTKPRGMSANGVYHVVVKGNNKNDIFCDDEDNMKFLHVLQDMQSEGKIDCYAFCLMVNHAHVMLRVKEDSISEVMRSIMLRYVKWYNNKYERTGRLFEDRFFSNPVTNLRYFMAGLQYIYNNPVKAGLCSSVAEYKWSSFRQLFMQENDIPNLSLSINRMLSRDEALRVLDENLELEAWEPREHLLDTAAFNLVKETVDIEDWKDIQNLDKDQISLCVKMLREKGANKKQICRVLGITRYNVNKLLK